MQNTAKLHIVLVSMTLNIIMAFHHHWLIIIVKKWTYYSSNYDLSLINNGIDDTGR